MYTKGTPHQILAASSFLSKEDGTTESRRKRMQLVEQHVIRKTDSRYQAIDAAAFASKNLYVRRFGGC